MCQKTNFNINPSLFQPMGGYPERSSQLSQERIVVLHGVEKTFLVRKKLRMKYKLYTISSEIATLFDRS
jgi:hypothetical protein